METNTSNGSENTQSRSKAPRARSVSYPAFTLESCLVMTGKISKEFSDLVFTPRESISAFLNVSGGNFMMQLSTCCQYGLLVIKSGEGYKPTDLYKKISRPLPDENVNDFMKECFMLPELYNRLISDFKDRELPTVTGFANILDRKYGVVGNASTIAAKVFFANIEYLGLKSNNVLKFDNIVEAEVLGEEVTDENEENYHNESSSNINNDSKDKQPPLLLMNKPKQPKQESDLSDFIEIPIPLKDGRKAKLLMPEGYSDEDIIKVHRVVTGYLP